MNTSNIPSLTGLRGFSAIWVLWHHFSGFASAKLATPSLALSGLAKEGFRGVDLFFLLSGFILMHVHAAQFSSVRAPETRMFYVERFFRVYPLNTAVLLIMIPLIWLIPGYVQSAQEFSEPHYSYKAHNLSALGFLQSLLLVQTWTFLKLGEWNGPAWTLSAEVLGYIMFPILAFGASLQKKAYICLFLAMTSIFALFAILIVTDHAWRFQNPSGSIGAARMLCEFSAGILMRRALAIRSAPYINPDVINSLAIIFVAASLFVSNLAFFDIFAFAALIFGLSYQSGIINDFFASPLMLFFGRISFSLYIIHGVIIGVSQQVLTTSKVTTSIALLEVFFVIFTIILCAVIFNKYVECPFQRLGRNIARRNSPTKKEETAAHGTLPTAFISCK